MPTQAIDHILAQPWAIQPEALQQIIAIAERANADPEAVEAKLGRPLQNTQDVQLRENGVAVLAVRGPIFRYANLFTRISGATSLELLARDFAAAVDNPAVRSIVLAIDSPGGEASGIGEFADMVRAADKPVIAHVDGIAASAAYWIAAAADEIRVSSSALLGSIGVVATYRAEKDGPMRIISTQSPLKQATPDTDSGRAEVQRVVDDLAAVFIRSVAAYRDTTPAAVAADFGEGGLLVGEKAIAAGMADQLDSFESIIAGAPGATSQETLFMSIADKKKTEGPEVTAEWLRAEHPDIHQAIAAAAISANADRLKGEGADAERARIQAVLAQSMPGHEALIERLAFDGQTTAEQSAVQILAAEKQLRAKAKQTLVDETPAPVQSAASATGTTDTADNLDHLSVEDRCQAQWDKDPALRAEFGTLDVYTAYARADAEGKIHRLGGKAA